MQPYGQKFDEYYGEEYDDEMDYGEDAPQRINNRNLSPEQEE